MAQKQTVGEIPADEKAIELARRLGEARGNTKQWGEIADNLRDELVDHFHELADANGTVEPKAIVAAGGVKVASVTESIRRTTDMDRLKADHPEIDFDKYIKISHSVTVRVGNI